MSTLSKALRSIKGWIGYCYSRAGVGKVNASKQRYSSGGGGYLVTITMWWRHPDLCNKTIMSSIRALVKQELEKVTDFSWNGISVHYLHRNADGETIHECD